jgi:putative PIN family toxin of toxin-antitoxin system
VRIVLDTNLLISALISEKGAPARLIDAWDDERFLLVSSEEQLEELKIVCRRPQLAPFIERSNVGRFINHVRAEALILDKLAKIDRSADPADNFLLAMVEAGGVDYLVSGDRRGVLALKEHGSAHILTAREMLAVLHIKPL